MIVVDTDVVACLYLPGDRTAAAEALLQQDPEWAAPLLWRSDMRNVLATQLHAGHIDATRTLDIHTEAERLLRGREYTVDSATVLRLVAESRRSAYDCEFVSVAEYLDVPLYSADRRLVDRFPKRARLLSMRPGEAAEIAEDQD